jgi:hypothetical protein
VDHGDDAWARPAPYRQPGKTFVLSILTLGVCLVVVFVGGLAWSAWHHDRTPRRATISYQEFLTLARANDVHDVLFDNQAGVITGSFAKRHREQGLSRFRAQARLVQPADLELLLNHGVVIDSPSPSVSLNDGWPVDAVLGAAVVISLLQLLGLVGVGGLIAIRYRAQRSLPLRPHIV